MADHDDDGYDLVQEFSAILVCTAWKSSAGAEEDDRDKDSSTAVTRRLVAWNDSMEAFLLEHRQQQQRRDETKGARSTKMEGDGSRVMAMVATVTDYLHDIFLTVWNRRNKGSLQQHRDRVAESKEATSHDQFARDVLERWRNSYDDNDGATATDITNGCSNDEDSPVSWDQVEIMRATQDWFRYYLQVLVPSLPRLSKDDGTADVIMKRWQTPTMLELLLVLMERTFYSYSSYHQQPHTSHSPDECAKFASQILFYTTFPIYPGRYDEALDSAFAHLTSPQCGLMPRVLRLLTQTSSLPLTLSLVRNVHNALSSYPHHASRPLHATVLDIDNVDTATVHCLNSWAESSEASETSSKITYRTAFCEILLHSLQRAPFPGQDDRMAELVIEILRCCYSIRIPGKDLTVVERWKKPVSLLLNLDSQQEQCYECQVAGLSLLMESTNAAAEQCASFLMEALQTLLTIMDRQIALVLDRQYVDDRAVAALTPILVVLQKCSNASPDFLRAMRDRVFTNEQVFQDAIFRQRPGEARNMSPMDAPRGTHRWKLIQLLTWPQGFVKRLAGELLWTLCRGDRTEFVRRVGMGNALPILSLRGLVQLPPGIHS
jgi:Guanine nucleotide exchange factor synembryn